MFRCPKCGSENVEWFINKMKETCVQCNECNYFNYKYTIGEPYDLFPDWYDDHIDEFAEFIEHKNIKMDGKALADDILSKLKVRVERLKSLDVTPCLAIISSGGDAGNVYVKQKLKACQRLGIKCIHHVMDDTMGHTSYIDAVTKYNNDPNVHGIIVQLPIRDYDNASPYVRSIINHISYEKDVDGLTESNVANIWAEDITYYEPCTPRGIVTLLKKYLGDISGKNAVIIGRSDLVGKPLAGLLLREDCTVTICHSKTKSIIEHIGRADIIITAIGNPDVIKAIPYGLEALVDVSINRDKDGYLVGDIPKEMYERCAYYTPVPGGVGPMTVAMLMENVVDAAENSIL